MLGGTLQDARKLADAAPKRATAPKPELEAAAALELSAAAAADSQIPARKSKAAGKPVSLRAGFLPHLRFDVSVCSVGGGCGKGLGQQCLRTYGDQQPVRGDPPLKQLGGSPAGSAHPAIPLVAFPDVAATNAAHTQTHR